MVDDNSQAPSAAESPPKAGIVKRTYTYLCVTTPKAAYFLLINTFLESINTYGAYAVYIVYMHEEVNLSPEISKLSLHLYYFGGFVFPIVGAILGDMYISKIWLLVSADWLSMALRLVLALSSYYLWPTDQLYVLIVFLVLSKLTGLGAPSRTAFPGDQYDENLTEARDNFYYAFFFAFNFGSFLGQIIIPMLRTDIHCIKNKESCYLAAFGGCVAISLLGTAILFAGWRFYIFLKPEKKTNWKYMKCYWYSLRRRIALVFGGVTKCSMKACKHNRDHWLDLADDKFDEDIVTGTKVFWNTAFIFTSFPVFFALLGQLYTMWTLMSEKLDGRTIFGQIKPDQMGFWNPLLVTLLILIFPTVIYPLGEKVRFLRKPLERIGYGFVLCIMSYVIGGIVCIVMENGLPAYPAMDLMDIAFHNGLPCNVNIQLGNQDLILLKAYESIQSKDLKVNEENMMGTLGIDEQNCSLGGIPEFNFKLDVEGGFAYSVLFVNNGSNTTVQQARQNRTRNNQNNSPKIRFVYVGPNTTGRQLYLGNQEIETCIPLSNILPECSGNECPEYTTETSNLNRESNLCYWNSPQNEDCTCDTKIGSHIFLRGGIYDVMIVEDSNGASSPYIFATAEPDLVPILWQIPMYVLITSAEVMSYITAHSFAYSESPPQATSFLQAVFIVSFSIGNLLVIATDVILLGIQEVVGTKDYMRPQNLPQLSTHFFTYAVFMFLDLLYFIFLARKYKYMNPTYQAIK